MVSEEGGRAGRVNSATRFPRLGYITTTTPRLQRQHAAEVIKGGKCTLLLSDKKNGIEDPPNLPSDPIRRERAKRKPAPCSLHACSPASEPIFEPHPLTNTVRALVPRWYCQQPSTPPRANPNHSAPALARALSRTAWGARALPVRIRSAEQAVNGATSHSTHAGLLRATTDDH